MWWSCHECAKLLPLFTIFYMAYYGFLYNHAKRIISNIKKKIYYWRLIWCHIEQVWRLYYRTGFCLTFLLPNGKQIASLEAQASIIFSLVFTKRLHIIHLFYSTTWSCVCWGNCCTCSNYILISFRIQVMYTYISLGLDHEVF